MDKKQRMYKKTKLKFTKKQQIALSLLEEGKNIFLTGPGGVGKTAVLKAFRLNSQIPVIATSMTGTSALLLQGTTLHSYLGIGLGKGSVSKLVDKILTQKWLTNRWQKIECLVIDEISMMHPDLFDKLEEVARIVRVNNNPFGGIQLVLSGDFLQLPCIGTMNFCFEAKTWQKCVTNVVYLDEIIRQCDIGFQNCLNQIRLGNVSSSVRSLLNSRVRAKLNNDYGIIPTKLYATNQNVRRENTKELDKLALLGHEFFEYQMDIEGDTSIKKEYLVRKLLKYCPVSQYLELCVGAQVMLVKNIDLASGLANGSRGIIMRFTGEGLPIVKFLNGQEQTIGFEMWELDDRDKKKVLKVYQIPLRVAYAISIHKSQGCSLDYTEIDLSNIFEYGQAYVALSRVKSISGLSIRGIDYSCIQADPVAVKYYKNLL